MTKQELEALKNNLLTPTGPDDKITAVKHKQAHQSLINELYDHESRANLLALIDTVLSNEVNDRVVIIRNGTARLINTASFLSNTLSLIDGGSPSVPKTKYQKRRGTSTQWELANPVLEEGEEGLELDSGNTKTGDGITPWNNLPYNNDGSSVRSFKGRFSTSAQLISQNPTGDIGDYAIVTQTNTYWQWNPDNSAWEDTGDPVDEIEIDATPTNGSNNAVSSNGVYQVVLNLVPNNRTINGKPLSSNVTLDKGDLGLTNVDNTADADKPISNAAANALAQKIGSGDVYAIVKAILAEGGNIGLQTDDVNKTITISATATGGGGGLEDWIIITPESDNVNIPFPENEHPHFGYTAAANYTWTFSDVPSDANKVIYITGEVLFNGTIAEHEITLPSGYTHLDSKGFALADSKIVIEGAPNGSYTVLGMKKGGRIKWWWEQAASSGGGLTPEQIQDLVADMVVAGDNITISYDDTTGKLTFASSGDGGTPATQTEVNEEENTTGFVNAKTLSEKPVFKEEFSSTLTFQKTTRDTFVDMTGNLVIDADLTNASHGASKYLNINGDNSSSLSFTSKFEKTIGSLDFDNSRYNKIFLEYDSYANKIYYTVTHYSRLVSDLAPPVISTSVIDGANRFVDITFNEGVFTNSNGSGGLTSADLSLTFNQNGGTATAVSIVSVKRNDNVLEASASALLGGETTVRVFLATSGNTSGDEFISIRPASGTAIYDGSGNAMLSTATTGNITMNAVDVTAPIISGGVIAPNNSYLQVSFSEGVYTSLSGGAITPADFSVTFVQGSGSATAAAISSITTTSGGALIGGESVVRFNLTITGSPNGGETIEIKPVSGSAIYDAAGNAMSSTETTGPVNLTNGNYSAESQAVFARMPDALSTSLKNAMAAFWDSQFAVGNVDKIDYFLFFALNTQANALTDWTGKSNATLVNGAVYNLSSNLATDGVNDYINTGYTPSTSTKITQDNAFYGAFVKQWNHAAGVTKALFGCADGTRYTYCSQSSSNGIGRLVNSSNSPVINTSEAVFAANSLYSINRGGPTASALYKNGVVVSSDNQVSNGLPTRPMYLGARNNNGTADLFASGQFICFVVAQDNGFAHANFFSNLQTLISAVGA